MEFMNLIHTINALGAITMILIGSSWLKGYLKSRLVHSCCRINRNED